MADHHHGHARFAQLAHDLQHAAHQLGVEGTGGLIKQQNFWLERQRAGNAHALLLTARELAGKGIGLVGQAHPGQSFHAHGFGLGFAHFLHLAQGQSDIAQRRHVRVQVERLKHHAHLLAQIIEVDARQGDVFAVDHHRPRLRHLEQIAAAQQGAFARARGPDDEHQLARGHAEVHPMQHGQGAVSLAQLAQLQGWSHAQPCSNISARIKSIAACLGWGRSRACPPRRVLERP